jgi:hypothetical protein
MRWVFSAACILQSRCCPCGAPGEQLLIDLDWHTAEAFKLGIKALLPVACGRGLFSQVARVFTSTLAGSHMST